MSNDGARKAFLDAAKAWICDDYALDIRYMAGGGGARRQLWQALVGMLPLPPKADVAFRASNDHFAIGQTQTARVPRQELLGLLETLCAGTIRSGKQTLALSSDGAGCHYYSEMSHRGRWFSALHLQISGSQAIAQDPLQWASIDDFLRNNTPPFDGLADAATWLELSPPEARIPAINVRVNPPCDLDLAKCALTKDVLTLTLTAHPRFDVSMVALAVRAVPDRGLEYRRQIAPEIKWTGDGEYLRTGIAQIPVAQADGALTMLMIGTATVRRQWFSDPERARNNRFLAVQHFDKDLRMLRDALLTSTDSKAFERGVALLAFSLGFNPALHIETEAPDLVVTTPSGRLVLVECTTRFKDFHSKLGKLVDRRGSLSKALGTSGASAITAVLVCRQPVDQIGSRVDELRRDSVVLIAQEDLIAALERLRFPNDPDDMLDEALARLTSAA